jgi:UDP-N-acetylglucosamine 1-carboxyvinyltransferase
VSTAGSKEWEPVARLVIRGGNALQGTFKARGAKNAALPLMAASILARGDIRLERVPALSDVAVMSEILRTLGASVRPDGPDALVINTDSIHATSAPYELVKRLAASFDIAGPMLSRFREVEVTLPGGCSLGSRPVNIHIEGFRALGAEVSTEHGVVKAAGKTLNGARFCFPHVTVGATKNVMMAATLAEGVTILENAAREPEVVELARFLKCTGARLTGEGTSTITIEGVGRLEGGFSYKVIADRIETGTYLLGAAITGGDVTAEELDIDHVETLLTNLEKAGQIVVRGSGSVRVKGRRPVRALQISTEPYPGFPTDLHPPIVSLLSLACGAVSVVKENIFDGRFKYAGELVRLGADIRISDRSAVVTGVERLTGAPIDAPDIRAGGALVLAALAAEGESEITGLEFIDRGYETIERYLSLLGADIKRAA